MNDGTEHAEIRKLRRLLHRSSDLAAVRSAGEAMKLSMRPPFAKVSYNAKVLITKKYGRFKAVSKQFQAVSKQPKS
jgi:hypothetical protein